jgi:hypothetical protein
MMSRTITSRRICSSNAMPSRSSPTRAEPNHGFSPGGSRKKRRRHSCTCSST